MPPKRKCRKSPGRKSPGRKRRRKSPCRRKSPGRKRKCSPRRRKSPCRKRARRSTCAGKVMGDCQNSENCRWIQYVNSNGNMVRYCRYQSPKKQPCGRSIRSIQSGCKGKQMGDCRDSKDCRWIDYTNRNGTPVRYCRYQPTRQRCHNQTRHHDNDPFSIFLNNDMKVLTEIKRPEFVTRDIPEEIKRPEVTRDSPQQPLKRAVFEPSVPPLKRAGTVPVHGNRIPRLPRSV